ncbi:hypothetical protein [Thiolapillus sp.]|uniref:hypothetical protein n=1 Tax=Thiolapillus sp. TaxID=2017437 RepID=UPI003AF42B62
MISAAKIAHNPHSHASHALTRHDCALPAHLRITRTSATLAPARLIACPGRPAFLVPGNLRAWMLARLRLTPAPVAQSLAHPPGHPASQPCALDYCVATRIWQHSATVSCV